MEKSQPSGFMNNSYSNTKSGTVTIGGKKHFYRSTWEVNVAAYLEFLKNKGEIKEWEYEPTVFWFETIKRGVRSYKPDFRVTENDGTQYYIEVKGWMDKKSKTKLKRMRIYYPAIKIDVIDSKRYRAISKWKGVIPHWDALNDATAVEEVVQCKVEGCTNKVYAKDLCRKHYDRIFKKDS